MNIRWLWFDYVPKDTPLTKYQRRLVTNRVFAVLASGWRPTYFWLAVFFLGNAIALPWIFLTLKPLRVLAPLLGGCGLLIMLYLFFWISTRPHVLRILRDLGVNVFLKCGHNLTGQSAESARCPECGWSAEDVCDDAG